MEGQLADLSLEDFSKIEYKCTCGEHHSLRSEIVIRRLENGIKKIIEILPISKILLLCDEKYPLSNPQLIKDVLCDYEVITYLYKEGDDVKNVFSSCEDVGAVVVYGGETVMNVGRYFASVRNIFCVAVPVTTTAKGLINPLVKIKMDREFTFPAKEPDLIIVDGKILNENGKFYEGFSTAVTKSITIIDNKINSIMTGKTCCKELVAFATQTLHSIKDILNDKSKAISLFEANFKFAFCARENLFYGNERTMGKSLAYVFNESRNVAEFFAYQYLLQVYKIFFEDGFLLSEFTQDYVQRIANASKNTNKSLKSIIKNSNVPLNAEIQARYKLFEENKGIFLEEINNLLAEVKNVQEIYFKLGGKEIDFDNIKVKKVFYSIPELSKLVSVPVLMRDFGLI